MKTQEEMDRMLDEYVQLYQELDQKYSERELYSFIIPSLVAGQFIERRDADGKLLAFATYWMLKQQEVDDVKEGCLPKNLFHGDTIFISAAANKMQKSEMVKMINDIKRQEPHYKALSGYRLNIFKLRNRGGQNGQLRSVRK